MKYALLMICAVICNAESVPKGGSSNPKVRLKVSPENVENAVVLSFDAEVAVSFRGYSPEKLNSVDFEIGDSVTAAEISKYNASQILKYKSETNPESGDGTQHPDTIDFTKYKIQMVGMKNSHGERFLFVNCFSKHYTENWKRRLFQMMDGGNSYFHLLIHLDQRKCVRFNVNGDA